MVDTMVTDGVDTTDVTSTRGLLMLSPRPKLKLMLMPLTTIVKTTDILNDFTKDLSDLLLGIMDSESKTKLTNTPLTETSMEATETPTETTELLWKRQKHVRKQQELQRKQQELQRKQQELQRKLPKLLRKS